MRDLERYGAKKLNISQVGFVTGMGTINNLVRMHLEV
jgi:hypothetical protein